MYRSLPQAVFAFFLINITPPHHNLPPPTNAVKLLTTEKSLLQEPSYITTIT